LSPPGRWEIIEKIIVGQPAIRFEVSATTTVNRFSGDSMP
jgi:hypothetical protein